ncbi:hypothetical protein JXA63_04080 [Candidatus Woesebacteria bacterium]|nr:hypothetical protein [Candidatus Woesebacteria bacterium]
MPSEEETPARINITFTTMKFEGKTYTVRIDEGPQFSPRPVYDSIDTDSKLGTGHGHGASLPKDTS